MAAIASVVVASFFSEALRQLRLAQPDQLLRKAFSGGSVENLLAARVLAGGLPDFVITGTTDTNTAASPAIELVANGVVIPIGTKRRIDVKVYAADADAAVLVEGKYLVEGAATPIVASDNIDSDAPTGGGTITAPTITLVGGASTLTLNAVGVSATNIRWYIEVYVGELIPLAFLP